jgi:hypothetical protein
MVLRFDFAKIICGWMLLNLGDVSRAYYSYNA